MSSASPSGMREYEKVYLKCNKCGEESEVFGHGEFKIGESPWLCILCDGDLIVTDIKRYIHSEYSLVECMICKTRDIVHMNVIASNKGWICPKCGPDEHGKGGSHGILQDIYYNPKCCTKLENLVVAQTSLDIF